MAPQALTSIAGLQHADHVELAYHPADEANDSAEGVNAARMAME